MMSAPVQGASEGSGAVLANLLRHFETLRLDDLGPAALLERYDTKFAFPAALLPRLLEGTAERYRALEVGGTRLARYETVYFDTPALDLYHAHHDRRFPRVKVRVRTYLDTGMRFLDIKRREAGGWGSKTRRALAARPSTLTLDPASITAGEEGGRSVDLLPVATVGYRRLTLVARDRVERVTLDVLLELGRGDEALAYPEAVVCEVKQPTRGSPSHLLAAMASLGVQPLGVSKYCLAVAALGNGARTDRFQPLLQHFERIGGADGRTPRD